MTPPGLRQTYRDRVSRPTRFAQLLDLGLALGIAGAGVSETLVPFSSRAGQGSAAATVTVAVVAGGALAVRRTRPLTTLLVVAAALAGGYALTEQYVLFFGHFVPLLVAVFSTARHGTGRVPIVGAGVGAVLLLGVDLFVPELQTPGEIVFHWGVFAIVWGFGFGLRRHERRAEESTRRAVEAEVAAAEQAMAAVLAERTRIARELHDIVAHSVSTMVVQAGAAEQVVGEDPELARRALAAIRSTGADALGEMRRVVAMLRDDEAGVGGAVADLAPQPGLDGLPALVAASRAAGLDVTLEVRGVPQPLPAGLELTGYRVVQEALTNARRHAGTASVRVLVEHDRAELRLEVADDGPGGAVATRPRAPGQGHGLVGMRERVAMYGGRVEAGPAAGGGFVVRVVLPRADAPGAPAPAHTAVRGATR